MVVLMHYSAAAVLEAHGPRDVREAVAAGRHLTTLAFSEAGSRSHFWAPAGHRRRDGDGVGSTPARAGSPRPARPTATSGRAGRWPPSGPMTLWLVPVDGAGLSAAGAFDGLGLRGNALAAGDGRRRRACPPTAMLGADGAGLDIALSRGAAVVPRPERRLLASGCMEALVDRGRRAPHRAPGSSTSTRRWPSSRPPGRSTRALLTRDGPRRGRSSPTPSTALETGRDGRDAAGAGGQGGRGARPRPRSTDLAMRVCGGAAFRKELGVERRFRDALRRPGDGADHRRAATTSSAGPPAACRCSTRRRR